MSNKKRASSRILSLIKSCFQHFLIILVVACLFAVSCFWVEDNLIPSRYSSSALMMVNPKQDDVANANSSKDSYVEKLVSTYGIVIKSRTVLEPIIIDLGLDMDYETLYDSVKVSSVDSTLIMLIEVTNEDPELAASICNKIISLSPDVLIDTVDAGSVKIIEYARINENPVLPLKIRDTVLAGAFGAILVVLCIALSSVLDHRFHSEQDVRERLELPVVGVIPSYDKVNVKGGKRKNGKK